MTTLHNLRHTATRRKIEGGADIISVNKVARHLSPANALRIHAREPDRSQENTRETINKSVTNSYFNRYATDSIYQLA